MFEATIIEPGAFDPNSKYNTKTNAIPSICASFESDVNVLANTGGKTDAIVEKLKLFVM